MPAEDSALLGYLRGVLLWRSRTRYCGLCGAKVVATDGGHALRCTNPDCATSHFPRTDPAVIMLVTDPLGRALLGRQPSWAAGMFSCLAGFVEPGETLEEAVAREVFEESGLRVHDIRYVASQPWPFPASLMVGFTAHSPGGTPVAAPGEIDEVRWISREEAACFGEPGAPGRDGRFFPAADSIARHLIENWRRG
jgi:NAD+ diphosphatase